MSAPKTPRPTTPCDCGDCSPWLPGPSHTAREPREAAAYLAKAHNVCHVEASGSPAHGWRYKLWPTLGSLPVVIGPPRVRFAPHAGVKLTLDPGQTVTWSWTVANDEGWQGFAVVYTYDADAGYIYRETYTDGRDCDGRFQTETHERCTISRLDWNEIRTEPPLASRPVGLDPTYRSTWCPAWERVRTSQRDHAAEAAGY